MTEATSDGSGFLSRQPALPPQHRPRRHLCLPTPYTLACLCLSVHPSISVHLYLIVTWYPQGWGHTPVFLDGSVCIEPVDICAI